MELNIRGRLCRELFDEKTTAYRMDLYVRFYPVLWPCEDAFREFLTVPDTSLQLSAAKTVYACVGAEEDVFLPRFTWKNLIFLQQNRLADTPGSYVAQDHVIHSISLYVLGIYAFFNLPVFQRKILQARDGMSATEDELLLQFIKKWKIFSFYHDLGYVFETLVGRDGQALEQQILSDYLNLPGRVLSECVSRSVARLTVATALVRRSRACFRMYKGALIGAKWLNNAGKEETPETLRQMLDHYSDYKLLEDVQSLEGLCQFSPFLRHMEGLAIVEKQRDCPLAFFKWGKNGVIRLAYRDSSDLPECVLYAVENVLPLDFKGISIRYYLHVEDFKQNLLNCSRTYKAFQTEAQQFDTYLPEKLRRQFSLICNDSSITRAFYEISDWHETHWSQENGEHEESGKRDCEKLADCFSEALRESVDREVQAVLRGTKLTVGDLEKAIETLGERIKVIDVGEIQENAIHNYEKEGIPGEIFGYSRRLYRNLWETFENYGTNVPYMRFENQYIHIIPFAFKEDNRFAKAMYDQMEKLARDLSLKMETLETYRPDYSTCDHGILSAALLFQALATYHYLAQAAKQNSPIEFAWSAPGGIHELVGEESVALYADAVFAIMLHNIYTRRARPRYGLCYQQNIDQNPFSFFCALMDNLQKWSRPKQIDFSVMNIPEDHYLGNDFDIDVSRGKIRVICHSTRAGKMREQLEYAEDYLPGILNLVCVTEEEI